jgi:hypothetical protein
MIQETNGVKQNKKRSFKLKVWGDFFQTSIKLEYSQWRLLRNLREVRTRFKLAIYSQLSRIASLKC